MRAVDLLETLPQVDKARIGVIGHSLGGHNSILPLCLTNALKQSSQAVASRLP